MRYNFIYYLTLIGLVFNLIGIFLLSLEAIGANVLIRIRDFLYKSPAAYNRRRKGFITSSFIFLILIFIIFRFENFDVLKLNFLFILTYVSIVLYFLFFAVFFWIKKIVSISYWMEEKFNKGIIGIIGFIFLSIGFSLQTAINLYLFTIKI